MAKLCGAVVSDWSQQCCWWVLSRLFLWQGLHHVLPPLVVHLSLFGQVFHGSESLDILWVNSLPLRLTRAILSLCNQKPWPIHHELERNLVLL